MKVRENFTLHAAAAGERCLPVRAVEAPQYAAARGGGKVEFSMRVTELPHVLGASEGLDHRGKMILRIVTDLPLKPKAPGHNAVKLQGLQKAIERIRATEPYLKYDHFELTNEGLSHGRH